MAREARRLSETGIYHVIFRGVNRYDIFEEDKDYEKILEIISDLKEMMKLEIYAYCLMSNHVHILVKEANIGDISIIMQRMLTRYAGWYNRKYGRSGILISNRFKSEPVESDEYLLTLARYIHQNPVKAGISTGVDEYKWSSFKEYSGQGELTDTYFLLSLLDKECFIKFNNEVENMEFELNFKSNKKDDSYIRNRIKEVLNGDDSFKLGQFPKEERDRIISYLKNEEKFSIRQIERATGISRGVIARCK
nr:transposase [Sedimentibacter sp.]